MKLLKNSILGFVALGATLMTSSCDSFLKEYSQDLTKVESWQDLDEVLLGAGYVHTGAMTSSGDELTENFDILHIMGDEMRLTGLTDNDRFSLSTDYFAFFTWQQDTGVDNTFKYMGYDSKFFDDLYSRINVCNMVIGTIDDTPETGRTDAESKERVKGEAHYLRGVYYFMLANLYCPPYNPTDADSQMGMPIKFTEFIEDIEFQRSTLKETYESIISDLEKAEEYLDGKTRKSIYHANQLAARLMLARVYLYMQDWNKAAEYANMVINEQPSLLNITSVAQGNDCLYGTSPETIFTMGGYGIAASFADIDGGWWGITPCAWYLTDEMLGQYADNDARKNRYIGESEINRAPKVFKKVNGQYSAWGKTNTVGSTFLLRTPEAYLILAEASAYNGDNGNAQDALQKFMKTRYTGNVSVSQTGTELIQLIRDERCREFLLEGHRWFDLRRYTVNQVFPWSKEIIHAYPVFGGDWNDFQNFSLYRLEPNDPAYTLPLPRSVRQQQTTIGSWERPSRQAFGTADLDYFGDEAFENEW